MLLIKTVNKSMMTNSGGDPAVTIQRNASSNIVDLLAVKNFIDSQAEIFGLNFSELAAVSDSNTVNTERIVDDIVGIRNRLRNRAIESKDKQLLKDCDDIRDCFKSNGVVLKDHGKLSSWSFAK